MTVSLRISKTKTFYLIFAFLGALAAATYSAQREVLIDTEVYYSFYTNLIEQGITNVYSCWGFEPFYCAGSYAFATLTQSEAAVHFTWAFLFYAITLRGVLMVWPAFVSEQNVYSVISLVTFLFVSLNYVDPQAVYFLTRQYVAASLLMLGVAKSVTNRSPVIPFACAVLIHFGALPIAAVIFLVTRRRIDWKLVAGALGVLFLGVYYYLTNLILIDAYVDVVTYKIGEYVAKNDGDVTIVQEIKLLIYWSFAVLMFWMTRSYMALAYVLVYVAYLFSFQNDLYHLRYHKFLEAMAWPSAFILFFIKREAAGHLMVAALCYRLYKYVSLLSPELGAPYMTRIVLYSFIAFLSWLLA